MIMDRKSILPMAFLSVMMGLAAAIIPANPAHAADQMYENHFGNTGMQYPKGAKWYAQTFTTTQNHQLTYVKLYLRKYGSPGTVWVSIRETDGSGKPTGLELASGTTNGNTLPQYGSGDEWRQVNLSPTLSLTQNVKFAIVVRAPYATGTDSICWNASYGGGGDQYAGGSMYESTSSGANWTEEFWWDGSFQVWGPWTPPPNQPPVLSNGFVLPSSGDTSTEFYYFVSYYDVDGDSPSVKDIYVDHVAHPMTLYYGSSASGIYRYGPVTLDCYSGFTYHRYSFSFNDGHGHTTCLPVSCSAFTRGPDVTVTFGQVLDNTVLSWSTGGTVPWYGQCDDYYWDHDAAMSGMISHSQSSWLETAVNGPGNLSFYWKVYSEQGWDWLEFYIDNVRQDRISGYVPWQLCAYTVSSGAHTLRWRYVKDGSISEGHDRGGVDKVVFEGEGSFYIIKGKDGKSAVINVE